MENFVGAERVAEFLGYKRVASVYSLVAKDGLPHRQIRGQFRFRLSEIEAWLTEQDAAGQAGTVHSLTERRSA